MGEPNPYPMPLNCVPPCSAKFELPRQKLKEEKLPRYDSVYRYTIKEHTVDIDRDSWIRTVRQRLNEVRPHLEPCGPCSIFKFPENLRRDGDNGKEYGPVVAAIGPYHNHHNQHGSMQAMRDHKWQCVRHLLSRHRNRDRASQLLDECLVALKALDNEVRSCYAESLYHLDPTELASIMFRDGCFILHLLLKQVEGASVEKGEEEPVVVVEEEKGKAKLEEVELEMGRGEEEVEGRLLGMSWVWDLVVFDLLKLENQIPFFVIRTIFDTIKTPADKGLDLVNLSLRLFQGIHPKKSRASTAMPATRIHHLLHLFHSSLVPCNPTAPSPTVPEWLPSATYLRRHGLEFARKATAESFLDVSFKDGRIEIPPLQVHDYSKSLFRNLIVFEQSFAGVGKYLTSYATLMECLVSSKEDAKLLGSEGIVVNRVGTDEVVADLFGRHGNLGPYASDGSYLADVFTEAMKYHESKRRAQLMHNCFSSPRAGVAIVVIVLLLLLVAEEVIFRCFFSWIHS